MNRSRNAVGLFFAALVIGSVALNALIFQLYADHRTRALADADRDLIARAEFLADSVGRTLNTRLLQTFTFAALPSLRAFAASDETQRVTRGAVAREELRALVAADDTLRAATIVDAFGIVAMTTDNSMLADWSERAFVRDALRGHLHASVLARDFGEYVQYYSAPILNNAGDVAGALVIRVAAQELWAAVGADQNVLLVDEDGVRLADRTSQPQLFVALAPLSAEQMTRAFSQRRYGAEITQIRATNLGELRDQIARGSAKPIVFRDADGKTKHAGIARLRLNFWSVVVLANEDEVSAPARDTLRDLILVAGLSLVIALVLGFIAGKFNLRAGEEKRD
ncbi:MAG: cache domain-containing protein [Chloroflexi bacterium]|nr:cache domain-containing protein [Chloroflexota bacterium]